MRGVARNKRSRRRAWQTQPAAALHPCRLLESQLLSRHRPMDAAPPRRPLWLRLLRATGIFLAILLVALCLRIAYAFRDRNPGYAVHISVSSEKSRAEPRPLRAGFARERINPKLGDPARPVYVAGFSQNRTATGIHDDLWSVACVIDDGHTRVGFVALDSIGLFHDDVIEIRRRLGPELGLAYTIIAATHNHSTPDLMGLWGPHPLRSGVDPAYREQVLATAARTLATAVAGLAPARVAFHEIPVAPEGLVADTRRPRVFDADVRVMHFTAPAGGATLGTLVTWGNHPETPWSRNTEITADFCGALRDTLERGASGPAGALTGIGGIHCFINGAVGGLMTTHPSTTVRDPLLGEDLLEPSHAKSIAVGRQLAARVLPRLREAAPATDHAPIGIEARTLELPVDNVNFLIAPVLGIMDRGHTRWRHVRSEAAVLRFGDATIACVPGEIYPEIVNGGVERAPGGDFDVEPVEVPPVRAFLSGRVKFVLGLANDEVGYIIPRSEWDREPPYLYGSAKPVYGEVNSLGPETAPRLHAALRELSDALR